MSDYIPPSQQQVCDNCGVKHRSREKVRQCAIGKQVNQILNGLGSTPPSSDGGKPEWLEDVQDGPMYLVYVDGYGETHKQPWGDVVESGGLIDDDGDDMVIIGWSEEGNSDSREDTPMYLVYQDEYGEPHYQLVDEVDQSGTLIDPETGDDMEVVGWSRKGCESWADIFDSPDKLQSHRATLDINGIDPDSDSDIDFGLAVYCHSHRKVHQTGWCHVPNAYKYWAD